jgi:ankyrin repeat protein
MSMAWYHNRKISVKIDRVNNTALQVDARPFLCSLLDAGAAVDARDAVGKTPLAVALFNVRDRGGEVISVLLRASADPDAKNNYGVSARQLAASVANYDLMRFFN